MRQTKPRAALFSVAGYKKRGPNFPAYFHPFPLSLAWLALAMLPMFCGPSVVIYCPAPVALYDIAAFIELHRLASLPLPASQCRAFDKTRDGSAARRLPDCSHTDRTPLDDASGKVGQRGHAALATAPCDARCRLRGEWLPQLRTQGIRWRRLRPMLCVAVRLAVSFTLSK